MFVIVDVMVFVCWCLDLLLQCPQGSLGELAHVNLAHLVVQGTPDAHPVLVFSAFIRHVNPSSSL